MNWILLFFILPNINLNGAAPVDLTQTDVVGSKDVTMQQNATDSAEIIFDLKKSHTETEEVDDFTSKSQHLFESNAEKKATDSNTENHKTKDEVHDNYNRDIPTTSKYPMEGITEYKEVLQDDTSYSKAKEFQTQDIFTESPKSYVTTSTVMLEPAFTQVVDVRENVSDRNVGKEETLAIPSTIENHTEMQDFQATNEGKLEKKFEETLKLNTYTTTTPETTMFPTENSIDLKYEEIGSPQAPTLKQAFDYFIDDVLEIGDKLGFIPQKTGNETTQVTTDISGEEMSTKASQTDDKELNMNNSNNENNPNQTQSFEENATGNYKEILDQYTTFSQITSDLEDEFVKDIQTSSETMSETTQEYMTTQSSIREETVSENLEKLNFDASLQIHHKEENVKPMLVHFITTDSMLESSNISSTLKETVDSVTNTITALGQSLEETLKEVTNNSSSAKSRNQDDKNSEIDVQLNTTKTELVPTFKQAIDSFIEDIVQIGDNLGLTEQSSINESVSLTTEIANTKLQTESFTISMKSLNETSGDLQTTTVSERNLPEDGDKSEIDIASAPYYLDPFKLTEQNLRDEHFQTTTEFSIAAATPITTFEQILVSENLDEISRNLEATTYSDVNLQEEYRREQQETTLAPTNLENFNQTLQKSKGRSLEYSKANFTNSFEKTNAEIPPLNSTKPVANNESNTEKTGTYEQSTVSLEREIATTSILATLNETEEVTLKEQESIQVLDTTSIPEIYTISMLAIFDETGKVTVKEQQANIQILNTTSMQKEDTGSTEAQNETFKDKLEVPNHGTWSQTEQVNEKMFKQPEINLPIQEEENQEENLPTIQPPNLGSLFDSTQFIYQTDTSNHAKVKPNESEQFQVTQTVSKEQHKEDEVSKLNSLTEMSTEMMVEPTEYSASLNLSYQTTLETTIETSTDSSLNIPHVEYNNRFEEGHTLNETTETNQFETSSSPESSTDKIELTTISSVTETTLQTQNYENELRTVVKNLEETIHHQLEEFQNNLKQDFDKFNALEAEKGSQMSATTTTENTDDRTQLVTTDTANNALNLATEELHRNGIIRQNFIDTFADNYVESLNGSTSLMEKELLQTQESSSNFEANKENTTKDVTQRSVTTSDDRTITKESTDESGGATTENISETTLQPILARVPLQKNFNSFSPNITAQPVTVVSTQEPTTQIPDRNAVQQPYSELLSTIKNTQSEDETTTLPSPETSSKEMVTFIQITETTTKITQTVEDKNQDIFATTQTPEKQTHSAFIAEEQQEIESTTEHAAQIESTDANEQIATTTNQEDSQTEQQTTEAEIGSTTEVVENETTTTPTESEARSLSLPPPKLEYLQSIDGVEVFYGYSIVKHN